MGVIISVVNQKGGVGKTTTSVNLASSIAILKYKTLLIDLDPQANAGSALGIFAKSNENSIYQVLLGGIKAAQAIRSSLIPLLDIIPSNTDLIGAEVELVSAMARETKLKKALSLLVDEYDFIIIDCPPSMGLLTLNALTASNGVIVPLQCEYYALEGLSHLLETVKLIKSSLNESLKIYGIVLTMYDARNRLCHQVVTEAQKHLAGMIYKTIIPRNVRLSEAPSHGKPIIMYDKNSKGAKSYMQLAKEVKKKLDNKNYTKSNSKVSNGLNYE